MSIVEKLQTIAENEQRVFKAGQDDFLKTTLLSNGKRAYYGYMFRTCVDLVEAPYFEMVKSGTCQSMFYGCTKLKVVPQYDFTKATAIADLFVECTSLEELPEIIASNATNCNYAFHSCKNLRKIAKLNVSKHSAATTITSIFSGCSALEEIEFVGTIPQSISFADSPLLSDSTIASIINALRDWSGTGATKTLTLHENVKAKLTEEQIAIANQKGWTIA